MKVIRSFIYAWNGVSRCIKKERNFKIHMVLASLAVVMGVLFGISATEWCLIILCTGLVLSMELLNTAIEQLCNKVQPAYDEVIALVKDISAGAVLITAIASAICGSIIFLPKLF